MEREIMMMRKKRRQRKKRARAIATAISVILGILVVSSIFNIFKNRESNNKGIFNLFGAPAKTASDKLVVCIDPGHGGYDIGAKKYIAKKEKEINLEIALELGRILEKSNIKVIYTRDSDKVSWPDNEKEDLKLRCEIANKAKADIFISIHCNSDNDPKIKGIETWSQDGSLKSKELAKVIQQNLSSYNYSEDRGVKTQSDKNLYVLRNTQAAAVLVEIGYISNASDNNFISSSEGQKKIGQAIADSILKLDMKE